MYTTDLINLFDEAFFGFSNTNRKFESVDGQTYEIALPGFSKKDLNIEVNGRILNISAKIEEKEETRWRYSFNKKYSLPDSVNTDDIKAKMENGVLQISFGKNKDAKKVTIS